MHSDPLALRVCVLNDIIAIRYPSICVIITQNLFQSQSTKIDLLLLSLTLAFRADALNTVLSVYQRRALS